MKNIFLGLLRQVWVKIDSCCAFQRSQFCLEEGLVSRFHHEQKIMRTLYYFYQKFFLGKILNCPYRPTLEKKIVLINRLLADLSL